MDKENVMFEEQFKLMAWSSQLKALSTLAKYALDQDGILHIQPVASKAPYFEALGLAKGQRGYRLDTVNHPTHTIAKALGLHANDPGVGRLLRIEGEAREMTGYEVIQLALKGVDGQMGRLLPETMKPPVVHLEISSMVDQNNTDDLRLDNLHISKVSEVKGLVRRSVLIRDANKLKHGYILTAAPGKQERAMEKLAIYAGTLSATSGIPGVISDKVIKSVVLDNGQIGILCLDGTKPEMTARPSAKYGAKCVEVEKSMFNAGLDIVPAHDQLRASNGAEIGSYLAIKLINGMAQDTIKDRLNEPALCETKWVAGKPSIPDHMNLHLYMQVGKAAALNAESLCKRLFQTLTNEAYRPEAADGVVNGLKTAARATKAHYADLQQTLDRHLQQTRQLEQPARAKVREYDISHLMGS